MMIQSLKLRKQVQQCEKDPCRALTCLTSHDENNKMNFIMSGKLMSCEDCVIRKAKHTNVNKGWKKGQR